MTQAPARRETANHSIESRTAHDFFKADLLFWQREVSRLQEAAFERRAVLQQYSDSDGKPLFRIDVPGRWPHPKDPLIGLGPRTPPWSGNRSGKTAKAFGAQTA
jgi:hypothetical protein